MMMLFAFRLLVLACASSLLYRYAPLLRLRVARCILSRWTGISDIELNEVIVSLAPLRIVLLGLRVPNPCQKQLTVAWSHEDFTSIELIEIVADDSGLLGLLGLWTVTIGGTEVALGGVRQRLRSLRIHGVQLNLEELATPDGESVISNLALLQDAVYGTDVDASAAPADSAATVGVTHAAMDGDSTIPAPNVAPGAKASARNTLMDRSLRGLRESFRDGLAAAIGDEASQAVVPVEKYSGHERQQQRLVFEQAFEVINRHISIGSMVVSAVSVRGAIPASPVPLPAHEAAGGGLSVLGFDRWEIQDFEGPRSRLSELLLAGARAALLQPILRELAEQTRQAAKARIGVGLDHAACQAKVAKEVARGMAKGVHREVKEAAREVAAEAREVVHTTMQESVAGARAVVEGGATMLAKAKMLGSSAGAGLSSLAAATASASLPSRIVSTKLGLVGWSEANVTATGERLQKVAKSQ